MTELTLFDVPEPEPSIFDAPAAKQAAEDGMAKALRAERVALWKASAIAWIIRQQPGKEFACDDLTRELGVPDQGANRNNVMGAIFSSMAKTGAISWTGAFRKSKRVDRHGGFQKVWRRL